MNIVIPVINYKYKDAIYNVKIIYKNIKNTYIRVSNDNEILVTTNKNTKEIDILNLIDKNIVSILKMFERKKKTNKENYYLGKKYNIIYVDTKFSIIEDYIYVKDKKTLDKWYSEQIKKIYKERLDTIYNKFIEKIPYPNLKIRKMKTRWGVCNRKSKTITLNYNLIYYDINCLDYVITHELSHFIEFNHSKKFWAVVYKYYPNYKEARKELKE